MEFTTHGTRTAAVCKSITARQLAALCAVSMISPATLSMTYHAAKLDKSGWLLPVVCLPVNLLLVWMTGYMYKKQPGLGLPEMFIHVFGGFLGRVLLLAAGVLAPLTFVAFGNRLFASRFTASIFPYSPQMLFLLPVMALTFYITRRELVRTARMGSLLIIPALSMLLLVFLLAAGSIESGNLLPVSPRALDGFVVHGASGLTVSCIIVMGGMLSRNVNDRDKLGRETCRAVLVMSVFLCMLLVISLGVLGSGLAGHVVFPFFSAVKALSVSGILERVDAFAISLWMLSDIMLMLLCFMTALNTLGCVFKLKHFRRLSGPLHFLVFAAAALMGGNTFEVQRVMRETVEPVCLAVILLPVPLLFAVGKLRKKI